jgi:hypothetical protein
MLGGLGLGDRPPTRGTGEEFRYLKASDQWFRAIEALSHTFDGPWIVLGRAKPIGLHPYLRRMM